MWITRVSINHPVFATMMMVALCVLGIVAYGRLGVEQLPDISPPVAFVDVRYPGASPEAAEREITKLVEESLNSIAGVKRITSRSFEGRSQTSVEFSLDTDMSRAMQDLRDRLAVVQGAFPREARQPTVVRFNSDNSQPTVVMALVSANRSVRELSVLAEETIARRMQRVEGVAVVSVTGTQAREVRVNLDADRLRALAITPAEVSAALAQANTDHPVGTVSNHASDTLLRVEGRVRDPKAFADIVVARRGNLPIVLSDVGTIVEQEREAESTSRINGQRAITLNVFKQQDANIVKAGDGIKAAVDEVRKQLPPDTELKVIFARSDWVKNSLVGLRHTLIEGALLTVAIVFLFLHSWRSTVITGLTLPIAVISSFIAVQAFGFTLNFMTMMALSLCIGLLIDDAIVVRENIVRHLGMGKGHRRASLEGTQEIGLAVMATTFAICAVFVPIAFMGGIVGKFFYPFGITVVVAVLISLFVSFTLDPMLSSVWRDPPSTRLARVPVLGWLMRATDRYMDAMHGLYEAVIRWAFSPRRWRVWLPPLPVYARGFKADGTRDKASPRRWRLWTITPRGVIQGVGQLSLLIALGLTSLVDTELVPRSDDGFTQLSLRMTVGSSLERSDAKVKQVEALVRAIPEIDVLSTSVGGEGQGLAVGRNQAVLNITLKPKSARTRTQKQVEDEIRERIAPIAGLEASVGFDRPIYVAILGSDADGLTAVASDFAEQVKKIPGIVDVEFSAKPGIETFAVRLKPSAVRELGLTPPTIAANLRAYVNGDAATVWTTPEGERVEVNLRLPLAERRSLEQMRNLPVAFARDGSAITLAAVADVRPVFNPEVIRRQNLQRREAIFAGVQGRAAGEVGKDVQALVKATQLPPGYSFDVGGQTREQEEVFKNMMIAMGMAVIFIYIVLASQFGSFLQPLAIMTSLPLALIGVMLALLLWRSTLNLFSMIGLVMLMGLVTKNAILLVDFANQARRAGASLPDALLQAGQTRMRPILMTTAAMVFGMLPLALALNEGGELQAPMGRAIIGGVIASTLLTLVVVPVTYSYLIRRKHWPAGASVPAQDEV